MELEQSDSGAQIHGGRIHKLNGRHLYLLDTSTDRWVLPVFKTSEEGAAIRRVIASLGGEVNGAGQITDGDAFIDDACKTFLGKPVDIGFSFTFWVDGALNKMSYRAIRSRVHEKALRVLEEMRETPIHPPVEQAAPPPGWDGWVMR